MKAIEGSSGNSERDNGSSKSAKRTFENVPKTKKQGSIVVDGKTIMAFLADDRDDGGIYVADDLFDAFGNGMTSREPAAYVHTNKEYLEELARVETDRTGTKHTVKDLIGLRRDGRYWCCHQVAVNYVGWLDKRMVIAVEQAAIMFMRKLRIGCLEWRQERSLSSQATVYLNGVIDRDVDDPPWAQKKGLRFPIINNAVQTPFNKLMGGPEGTEAFKQMMQTNTAMDAYDTPVLSGVTLARSILASNIATKKLRKCEDARDEAQLISKKIAEVTKQLLAS